MKTYTLKGLDCANCAAQLERTLAAHPGVRKVSIDFPTLSLKIDTDEMDQIKALIAREEPEVVVQAQGQERLSEEKGPSVWLTLLPVTGSFAVTLVGLILEAYGLFPEGPLPAILWFGTAYFVAGWPVLKTAILNLRKGEWMDENFLMSIATVGAFLLGEWEEAVGVMVFYRVGEFLQDLAVEKSRKTIRALAGLRPETVRKKEGELWVPTPAGSILPGDLIQLHPGERVPVDGRILAGEGNFDTAALTGEPLPRRLGPGKEASAGMVNLTGLMTLKVLRPQTESAASRILALVENALHAKARREKFITRFARYYTPAVVIAALVLALVPPLFTGYNFEEWIRRALILLVISCPCALVLGIPLTYFAGLGGAARRGILFKGSNSMETLAEVKSHVLDKTGTLTEGTFALKSLHPAAGVTEEELLALAVEAEGPSAHPLAHSLRRAWSGLPVALPESFTERAGFGVESRWPDRTLWAGNRRLMEELGHRPPLTSDLHGGSEIHVADQGGYKGVLLFGDREKPGLPEALRGLRTRKQRLTLLSGDQKQTVEAAGKTWGVDQAEGGLLPADKLRHLEEIMNLHPGPHAFVGDGINDAPVLARADVGIALGASSTEAALEAADVAIQDSDPRGLVTALDQARRVKTLVLQNITLALGIKALVLGLGAFGMANLWLAVLADVGAALIVVANALRALR